ncbi:MAG: Ig-like domain-containing protein, partial [Alphaproteobacteria bacterium]
VTNQNASGPGSLRQRVLDANAAPGADKIVFAPGVKQITPSLAPVATGSGLGPLVVSDDLHIQGPGSSVLKIDDLQSWLDVNGNLNVGLPCGQPGTVVLGLSGVLFQVATPGVSLKVEGVTVTGTGGLLSAPGDRAGGIVSFRDLDVDKNAPVANLSGGNDCRQPLVDMGWGGQLIIENSQFVLNKIGFNTIADTGMMFVRSRLSVTGSHFQANSCHLSQGGGPCSEGTWDLRVYRGPLAGYAAGTADRADVRDTRFDDFVNRVSFENQETTGTMSVFITNTSFFEALRVETDVNEPSVRAKLAAYTGVQTMNADLSLINVSILIPSYKYLGDEAVPLGSGLIGSHLNASGKSTVRMANTVLHTTSGPSLAPGEKFAPLAGFERCGSLPGCQVFLGEQPVSGAPGDLPTNFVDDPSVAAFGDGFVGVFLYLGYPAPPGTIVTKYAAADGAARYPGAIGCQPFENIPGAEGYCSMAKPPDALGVTNPPVNGGSNALAVYPDGTKIVRDVVGRDRVIDVTVDIGAVETVVTSKPDLYTTASGTTLQVPASSGVLANDLNCGTGPLAAVTPPGAPNHGQLVFASSGAFTYVPDPGFVGLDAFSYRIATKNCPLGSYTTIVTIEVTAAPVTPTPTPSPTPTPGPPTATPAPTPTPTALPPTPTPSTLVADPFAQVSDSRRPDRDTWTVRGKVTLSDADADRVVSDGLWGGLVARIYQASGGGPSLLDTGVFSPFVCTSTTGGRSLYCKSGGSFARLRRTRSAKDPNSFRITVG